MKKFKKAEFQIATYDTNDNSGKFVIEPLERGFGLTLGNALRRVLLSSLPGVFTLSKSKAHVMNSLL